MFASLKSKLTLSLAALTLGVGLAASATPASAHFIHGGGGHFGGGFGHGGFGHGGFFRGGFHRDHWRGHWGPGWGFGVGGGDSCVEFQPIFDADGNQIGQRPVNVCE